MQEKQEMSLSRQAALGEEEGGAKLLFLESMDGIEIIECLDGEENEGNIYRIRRPGKSDEVYKQPSKAGAGQKEARNEIKMLQKLDHPHIIHLIAVVSALNGFVMELGALGSLAGCIEDRGQEIPFVTRLTWAMDLIQAVRYLHEDVGMVHRDIKSENVLLCEGNRVKLADFGVAAMMARKEDPNQREDLAPLKTKRHKVGTAIYLTPEVAREEKTSSATDIYQLGLLLKELGDGALIDDAPQGLFSKNRGEYLVAFEGFKQKVIADGARCEEGPASVGDEPYAECRHTFFSAFRDCGSILPSERPKIGQLCALVHRALEGACEIESSIKSRR